MSDLEKRPRVATATIVVRDDGKVLMGQRVDNGLFGFPGGKIDFRELMVDCAARETLEETGLIIDVCPDPLTARDHIENETDHFITIYLVARVIGGELANRETQKNKGWDWYDWSDLPMPTWPQHYEVVKVCPDPVDLRRKSYWRLAVSSHGEFLMTEDLHTVYLNLLILMDPDDEDTTRALAAETLEEEWDRYSEFLHGVFLAQPAPEEADVEGALALAFHFPNVHKLLEMIQDR